MCKNTLLYCLFARTLVREFKPIHKVVPDWEHWPHPEGTSWCSSFLDWRMFLLSVLMTYSVIQCLREQWALIFTECPGRPECKPSSKGHQSLCPWTPFFPTLHHFSVGTCWVGPSQARLPRPSLEAFACYLRTWWVSLKPQPDYQKEKKWVPAMKPCAVLFPMVWEKESWCGTPGFRPSAPTSRHCSGGLRTL